ncbi:MBL fold metallo-hydrolase [Vibrio rotiferianus]|uniref:MBL fold metallo-hydrolase n=1 Tax=Vibrio rotiferianus TaxID=190895 RepID=UPI00406AA6C1
MIDSIWQVENKTVTEITDGVYRISGWGISSIIAVEAPEGWIIIDTGDDLNAGKEQRAALENKLDKQIDVSAILYTHSHYVWGAKAWYGDNTNVYARKKALMLFLIKWGSH